MDIFEEIGRRLTEIGQSLMMYVKNFSAVNQINSKVSGNEKQIAQLINELGQAYYEDNKDQASALYYDKIAAITALQAEIEESNSNYAQMQNAPKAEAAVPAENTCTNCGSTIPAGSTFCTNCGTKLG